MLAIRFFELKVAIGFGSVSVLGPTAFRHSTHCFWWLLSVWNFFFGNLFDLLFFLLVVWYGGNKRQVSASFDSSSCV